MTRKHLIIPAIALSLAILNNTAYAQQAETTISGYRVFNGKSTINATEDGKKFEIEMEGSKIIELSVDGKKISEDDYAQYEPAIKRIQKRVAEEHAKAEAARAVAAEHRKEAAKHRQEADIMREDAKKAREKAEVQRKEAEKNRAAAEHERERAEQHRLQADKDRSHAERMREEAQQQRAVAETHRQQAELHRQDAERHRAEAEVHRKAADEQRKQFNAMIDEMVKDKLINGREELRSFSFDDKELIINGVKQADATFRKYKEKYFKNTSGRISFRTDGHSQTISLD